MGGQLLISIKCYKHAKKSWIFSVSTVGEYQDYLIIEIKVMTNLQQIQEHNRRKIIRACNPEAKSYEEALEIESESNRCEYMSIAIADKYAVANHNFKIKEGHCWVAISLKSKDSKLNIKSFDILPENHQFTEDFEDKILGLPLTLDRVLTALSKKEIGFLANSLIETVEAGGYYEGERVKDICCWDLTKSTLEEQSEETQRAIYKLLGGENENN